MTCDPADREALDERDEAVIRRPWFVVEILSATTAADDTTDKLDAYQTIDALTHYVVIDSRRRMMRLYERLSDGGFALRAPLLQIVLPDLVERGISLDEVYRDTSVPRIGDIRSPRI